MSDGNNCLATFDISMLVFGSFVGFEGEGEGVGRCEVVYDGFVFEEDATIGAEDAFRGVCKLYGEYLLSGLGLRTRLVETCAIWSSASKMALSKASNSDGDMNSSSISRFGSGGSVLVEGGMLVEDG